MSTDTSPAKPETAKTAKTGGRAEAAAPGPDAGAECPCGKTHELDPAVTRAVNARGPVQVLHGPAGSYQVPRVFAANHDVTAQNLQAAAEKYGFDPAPREAAR
jgi:hypothetical protein